MVKQQPFGAGEARAIVVLAAGQGTRMGEDADKAMIDIAGISMLEHVLRNCSQIPRRQLVIVRSPGQELLEFPGHDFEVAIQDPGRHGTAAALISATGQLDPETKNIVVLFADNPLLRQGSIENVLAAVEETSAVIGLATALEPDPGTRGRIIRRAGEAVAIREVSACSTDELQIQEFNCGAMALDLPWAIGALRKLKPNPDNGEFYMTTLVELAANECKKVAAISIADPAEALGCDDFESLAAAEMHYFRRRAAEFMKKGVRISDPDSVAISADAEIGSGTLIERNVSIEGNTEIGSSCRIGQDSVIRDSNLAEGCEVASSRIIGSECGPAASIGPNALIRDSAFIGEGAQAGNCVEIKNSRIGAGTLIGHLCYVGDADVGPATVIGAGAITCNFDGVAKHRTVIGAGAFIGSNVSLIAPIRIGDKAVVGAGSVATRDVPEGVTVYGNPARIS